MVLVVGWNEISRKIHAEINRHNCITEQTNIDEQASTMTQNSNHEKIHSEVE